MTKNLEIKLRCPSEIQNKSFHRFVKVAFYLSRNILSREKFSKKRNLNFLPNLISKFSDLERQTFSGVFKFAYNVSIGKFLLTKFLENKTRLSSVFDLKGFNRVVKNALYAFRGTISKRRKISLDFQPDLSDFEQKIAARTGPSKLFSTCPKD